MVGQDIVATPKSAELAKQRENSEVDLSHKWHAASKEIHNRGRGGLVGLEKSLQVHIVMLVLFLGTVPIGTISRFLVPILSLFYQTGLYSAKIVVQSRNII